MLCTCLLLLLLTLTGSCIGSVLVYAPAISPLVPEARIAGLGSFTWMMMLIGLCVFGYTLAKNNETGYVAGQLFIGIASAVYFPALCGYIVEVKQQTAAAALAALHAVMFVFAALMTYVSVYGVQRIGLGHFFMMLALLHFLMASIADGTAQVCVDAAEEAQRNIAGHQQQQQGRNRAVPGAGQQLGRLPIVRQPLPQARGGMGGGADVPFFWGGYGNAHGGFGDGGGGGDGDGGDGGGGGGGD